MPHHRPADSSKTPRFTGVRTFMRLPHLDDPDVADVADVAIISVPTDSAVSFRSDARWSASRPSCGPCTRRGSSRCASAETTRWSSRSCAPRPPSTGRWRSSTSDAHADVWDVEVAPAYDPSHGTEWVAASACQEMLSLLALRAGDAPPA